MPGNDQSAGARTGSEINIVVTPFGNNAICRNRVPRMVLNVGKKHADLRLCHLTTGHAAPPIVAV